MPVFNVSHWKHKEVMVNMWTEVWVIVCEGSYYQSNRPKGLHIFTYVQCLMKQPLCLCTPALSAGRLMYCSCHAFDIQPVSPLSFPGWISPCVREWWQGSFPFPSHDRHRLAASPCPCKYVRFQQLHTKKFFFVFFFFNLPRGSLR